MKAFQSFKEDSIFIYDTAGKSQSERLNKLIEISCLKRFNQSKNSWQILLFHQLIEKLKLGRETGNGPI